MSELHYIRRHYPTRPVEPHEYAAWRAVLERAERNGWYCGADDRAEGGEVSPDRLRYAANGWTDWSARGGAIG